MRHVCPQGVGSHHVAQPAKAEHRSPPRPASTRHQRRPRRQQRERRDHGAAHPSEPFLLLRAPAVPDRERARRHELAQLRRHRHSRTGKRRHHSVGAGPRSAQVWIDAGRDPGQAAAHRERGDVEAQRPAGRAHPLPPAALVVAVAQRLMVVQAEAERRQRQRGWLGQDGGAVAQARRAAPQERGAAALRATCSPCRVCVRRQLSTCAPLGQRRLGQRLGAGGRVITAVRASSPESP